MTEVEMEIMFKNFQEPMIMVKIGHLDSSMWEIVN